jgi:hypothetical protein
VSGEAGKQDTRFQILVFAKVEHRFSGANDTKRSVPALAAEIRKAYLRR